MLKALLKIGWTQKPRQSGSSHTTLTRPGYPPYTWAWHPSEEIGPVAMRKIGKKTGLRPEDL
ncbi:MAG TPA: type II toxin-antitoxin system HicA family toxin [Terriglobales bacterium]|nr:type II toxin-antitoxin system HicA family toxin [Terriglobales bacterium]